MKTKILVIFAALAAAFSASALEYNHSVLINCTDGTILEYKFNDCPVAFVDGDKVNIAVAVTQEQVSIPMANITNLTFNKVSGVESVKDDARISFGITRETLDVAGLEPSARVTVYDVAGVMRVQGICGADGCVTIAIGDLDSGVYVVSAGDKSFKFIR